MERFQDENKWLGNFYNEIFVKCPKCESRAIVKSVPKKDCECGKCITMIFECKHCFYKMDEPIYQYVAYGKEYCNNCFEKFEYKSQPLKEKPLMYKTKCPHCNFQEDWKTKVYRVRKELKHDDGLVKECWYNLPLWFQKEVNDSIFWAYNQDHIDYLERYIQADLRERNSKMNVTSSLVSRLPQFVKAAKNREKLLKILRKWKE
ncbi:hypothetical protein B0A75_19580 [Flavobacterium oncorhynchi]|uniref:Replication restart DNA helicase PriA n=1 Tax=Flavobacterium oncorhynchi TaxID=728056 RepID=A0A226HKQ3_9FLAO|nr:hypothetical protein [Flavobacterium oncorhynchi]OXA94684.1 hypothetical protein B0A75_19580 [Flavobacterium oncorhynchi]